LVTNARDPILQRLQTHEIQNSIGRNFCAHCCGESEANEFELPWMVCICSKRNPCSLCASELEQIHIQILSIGIAIDLECLIEFGRLGKDVPPICAETEAKIVDASARMSENLDMLIPQRSNVSLSLIASYSED
jgi:hypothetical protein